MKLPKRIRHIAPALKDRAQVEETLREIACVTLRRNKLITDIDERIIALKKECAYDLVLTESGKLIQEKTELIKTWAEANPDEFGKNKSLELTHATIGFRTGNPAVKAMSGWNLKAIIEALLKKGPTWFAYIRKQLELDKEALIRDREILTESDLRTVGLRITQAEAFYIEPNLTAIDNTIKS